jgi:hypothetical protein
MLKNEKKILPLFDNCLMFDFLISTLITCLIHIIFNIYIYVNSNIYFKYIM